MHARHQGLQFQVTGIWMEEKQKHANAKTCGNLDVSKILLVSSNLLVIFPWTYWKERWSTNLRSPDLRPPGRGPELPRIAGMLATAAVAVGVLDSVPSRAPSWQWKTGARFKDRIFPTLFGTPQRSPNHLKLMHRGEPNLPGIRIQFVISDMLLIWDLG